MAFQYACSLISRGPELWVPPHRWTIAQFVGEESVSADHSGWHRPDATGDESGYIWPTVSGWGLLAGEAQWAHASDGTEFRMQFIRNPHTDPDTTGTTHMGQTPGGEYRTLVWPIYVRAGHHYALRVHHNASEPLLLSLAQFKVLV